MIITFCGHDNVSEICKVREWLCAVLDQFMHEKSIIFYLGGYGGFDRLAASVVRQKQKVNPTAQSVLIIPYINRKYDASGYEKAGFITQYLSRFADSSLYTRERFFRRFFGGEVQPSQSASLTALPEGEPRGRE